MRVSVKSIRRSFMLNMTCQKTRLTLLASLIGIFLLSVPVIAVDQTGGADVVEVKSEMAEELRDPDALAELERATGFLTAMPRFQVKAEVVYDVIQRDGRRLQFEKQAEIFLQRPDHFFAEVFLDDGRNRRFWYEGTTLGIAELKNRYHTSVKAPPTIDATLDMLEDLFGYPMPIADILYNDLDPLADLAEEADIVGVSNVRGHPCTQLAFRGKTVDWQIWIDQGEQPYIHKLAVSYRETPGLPQYVAWFKEWKAPETFNENLFVFEVPEKSQFVKVLIPFNRHNREGGQP